MVAQGANNAEIAAQLHLGQKTVRNYVSRIYRKLELSNRAQIATYVARTEAARGPARPDSAPPDNESRSTAHERTATQSADITSRDLATPLLVLIVAVLCGAAGSPTGSSSLPTPPPSPW